MAKIATHKDLRVYQLAFVKAMEIYTISKLFPVEEKYSLTDQIRRSSRSVCANLAEVQMVDYRCTDGCAVKCGGKYALLAKCSLRLYFTGCRLQICTE